jgi:GntR family transcriptional regulator, rspAB operon transcriptional repressor
MTFELSPAHIDRRLPLREQIYGIIRGLILSGSIKPGEAFDEKAIAAQLSVSRTPVREAVKKLSDENLVEVIAQSATRAARIDRKEIREAYLVRRALEIESAAQASRAMTTAHAAALQTLIDQHARLIEGRRYAEAIRQDDLFHQSIAMISELPRLWRMVEIAKGPIDRCRHMMLPRAGQAEATLDQHRAILRALASKDADLAADAMKAHLDAAYESTAAVLDGA